MLQFPSNPTRAPSHFALVDSGASIHVLTCHTFLSDAVVNHSSVASFAGSTSRATHKGTFAALVQCTNNKFHRLVQKNSALVVPDASRMFFSISQALLAGHHVHFGNSPGFLLKDTKAFIPFVRDTHTGMYLLPLIPPVSRHNGTYPRILLSTTHWAISRTVVVNKSTSAFRNPPARKLPAQYVSAKARRTDRPLPSDVTKRAQHP
jgi:hypothetical protein